MNDNQIVFTVPNVYLGKILPGTKHSIQFEFEGPANLIEDMVPSCGCTANLAITSNKITGTYHDNTALDYNTIQRLPKVGEDRVHEISKSIAIYLADGKPLKVQNERGLMVYNPEKTKIWLYLHGTVRFTPNIVQNIQNNSNKAKK